MSKSIQITLLKLVSLTGLLLTIIPSIMVFVGNIEHSRHITLMAIGMVLWFVTAPFWINKESK